MTNPHTLCPICHTLNRADARFCQKCGNNIWLNEKYRIIRAIKEGGMGAVYEAVDEQNKHYALKALIDRFTDPGERQEAIARFQEEANLLEGLKHPRIPRVYDHFEHGGRYYLSMDFVRGIDLEDLQSQQADQRFSEAQVLYWADQIADVLDYLHAKRLIYRDMKPSNVMIEDGTGDIKVVDFGIAKLFQPHQRGTLIGTPGYSPPEQYQGQATPQSDIFALGATLHHLLTGRDPRDNPPFSFPPVRELVSEVSLSTEQSIMKALEMQQDKRWPSAAAFRASLPMEIVRRGKGKPQKTVLLQDVDLAAKAAASPQAQQGRVTGSSKKRPKQPVPKAPKAPKAPAKRKRAWWPLMVVLSVVVLIALGQPEISDRLTTLFNDDASIATPILNPSTIEPTASGRTVNREYIATVTASVPAGSSSDIIKAGLTNSYEMFVKQAFGPATIISQARPVSLIGEWRKVSETETEATYEATISGFIAYTE